jgi:hypothetical protein
MIFIYNNVNKNNYCSFRLLPIGSDCSYMSFIKTYNISCYLNMNFSKYERLGNQNEHLNIIKKTKIIKQEKKFDENFLAFLMTIFLLTITSFVLFIGNII